MKPNLSNFAIVAACLVLSACADEGAPVASERPAASATQNPAVPDKPSDGATATAEAVGWDAILAAVPERDREKALDLQGDVAAERAKAAEHLAEAEQFQAEAEALRAEGDKDRAVRREERAARQRQRAADALADAAADEQRALALAGLGSTESTAGGPPASAPPPGSFGVERFKVIYDLDGQTVGQLTLYAENYGERVAIDEQSTAFGETRHRRYYWDGERGHEQRSDGAEVISTALRTKASEPTSFATETAENLAIVGYEQVGEKTIAGQACEHWRHPALNYDGCRWRGIELEFLNGAGADRIVQRRTAVEIEVGEGIPAELSGLGK